jgi:hypothetical protein
MDATGAGVLARLCLVALLWLAPIAAQAGPKAPRLSEYAGADAGRLLITLAAPSTLDGAPMFHALSLSYERVDAPGRDVLQPTASQFRPIPVGPPENLPEHGVVYDNLAFEGRLVSHRLPPGRYRLTQLYFNDVPTMGLQAGYLIMKLDIPFEIKPGKVTYLGQFWVVHYGKMAIPDFVTRVTHVAVSDQRARDIPLMQAEHPDYGDVEVAVPNISVLKETGLFGLGTAR